jgi:hypothetical protein
VGSAAKLGMPTIIIIRIRLLIENSLNSGKAHVR